MNSVIAVVLLIGGAWVITGGQLPWSKQNDVQSGQEAESTSNTVTATTAAISRQSSLSFEDEFRLIAEKIEQSPEPNVGRGTLPGLLEQLKSPANGPAQRINLRANITMEYLRFGEMDAAISHVNAALADVEAHGGVSAGNAELLRIRALVHLRRAEVANCVDRHNSDCCIFPLQGGAIHTVREPALKAKEDLLAYLAALPPVQGDKARMERILSAAWLLNIVCMALDEHPDGVPIEFRLPPALFASEYDIGRFTDIAPKLGLDVFDHAGGSIVDDFDNDGLLEVITSTCAVDGPLKAFRNVGDGTFEDVAAQWGLVAQLGGLNIVAGDYNNDGWLDIFVPRGAWMYEYGEIRNSLLRNNGDGSFTDVTREAGLLEPIAPTQVAVWADFDNDGWLDLFVGNESQREIKPGTADYPSALYRNNSDGTFTDIASKAGVTNDRYCKGAAAGDFDNDGDIDLYVSNVGPNRLYRNNGDMTFTDIADQAGVTQPRERSFATWFFDYDNDGWLDIWVGGYQASIADLAAQAVGVPQQSIRPCLYRNNRNGTFTNVTEQHGLARAFLPMGANFGDFDNDGWLDMYLGTGDPGYESLMPNIALRNDRGQRFQDITQSSGLGHLQKGHGIAFADIDNDGDQDIFHQLGAFFPGDAFKNALFMNPGHGHRFVTLELVGTQTNRMGYGARIKVEIATAEGVRTLHRAVGSVSSFGGSPRRQEIGLGSAIQINSIEVRWPRSGLVQRFENVPMDGFYRVTEGKDELEKQAVKKIDLATSD